jgi:hypothetical protein
MAQSTDTTMLAATTRNAPNVNHEKPRGPVMENLPNSQFWMC